MRGKDMAGNWTQGTPSIRLRTPLKVAVAIADSTSLEDKVAMFCFCSAGDQVSSQ